MSKGVVSYFNFNENRMTLNDFSFSRIYSLRRVNLKATRSIRVRRADNLSEQDIGFVNGDLDTAAITSFCSGTNGFIQTFYDQSGNGVDATHNGGTRAKIYDISTGLITKDGKISCQFTTETQYGFSSRATDIESLYFVASSGTNTLNYLLWDGSSFQGKTNAHWTLYNNYNNFRPFGYGFNDPSERSRGLDYLAGRNLGAFAYSGTASLYAIKRNGGTTTFGTTNISLNSTDRLWSSNLGRNSGFGLSLNGDLQEMIIGASGSNTGLENFDTINNLVNDYWKVY